MTDRDISSGASHYISVQACVFDIQCAYQPVVDLQTQRTVGYEALARWPAAVEQAPDRVFADARRGGYLDELDRAAQLAAVRGAQAAGLPAEHALFINVETDSSPALSITDTMREAFAAGPVVNTIVELTERTLLVDPARAIDIADTARSLGMGVALDDVGSNPESLTLLEFVAPSVIKLDATLINSRHLTREQATAIDIATAYVETRPSTIVIAEGIETPDDLAQARAVGASHGQGWLLGRPSPLPPSFDPIEPGGKLITQQPTAVADAIATPSSLLDNLTTQVARKGLLVGLTRIIEDAAGKLGEPVTMLAAFQQAHNFTPHVARRFSALGAAHPHGFVAVLGIGMPTSPAAHVHGTNISLDDELAADWVITVVGPHYYGALIARDRGDTCADLDRRYDYALTHDRQVVTAAARTLLRHTKTRGHILRQRRSRC